MTVRHLIRGGIFVFVFALGVSRPIFAQTSDDFFNPEALQRVEIWLNETDWSKLKAAFQENTYYPADVVWNGITVRNVGIRSRGLGSRSSTKPGLRVDFDRYSSGQHFLGLKSFVLDNLTQDRTGIKETVAMRFFTRLGIPAPRETHTRLYINGRYAGLYGLVESVDKTMMGRLFGSIGDDVQNDGYLFEYNYVLGSPWRFSYEGANFAAYKSRFDIKTNENHSESKIWGPIEELVRLVNNTPASSFEATVGSKLDLAAFVRYIAAQNFIAENDGFNGYDGMNNFYLYKLENSPRHVFIAWDEDNAFLQADYGLTTRNEENVLTRKTLELPAYQSQYFGVLSEAATSAADWMRQEMQRQFDMINDAMTSDTQKPYSNADYTADRDAMLAFPQARITYVRCEVAKQTGATRPSGCQ
ncbi:MAG TPA: CotH kinase family protein [Vicinamibacterales bacterium]|nr:CotH kinase family protein [Vicinamibacterales bacterium]